MSITLTRWCWLMFTAGTPISEKKYHATVGAHGGIGQRRRSAPFGMQSSVFVGTLE